MFKSIFEKIGIKEETQDISDRIKKNITITPPKILDDIEYEKKYHPKELNLRYKGLTEIPQEVLELSELEILNLNGNDISHIDGLSKLPNLKELSLMGNYELKNIDGLSKLINLKKLNLIDTPVEDISSIIKLTNLEELSLRNNKITNIKGLSKLINLKKLRFCNSIDGRGNSAKSIDEISKLTKLTSLSLYNMKITNIDGISKLINLEKLDLEKNSIQDISELSALTRLIKLDLGYNRIRNIDSISKLINLEELDLQVNNIKNVEKLSRLINLNTLYIQENNIEDISGLFKLIELKFFRLGDNQITNIEGISKLINLKFLSLSKNKLKSINGLLRLINLEDLDIDNCEISDISELSRLINLKTLYLNNNKIKNLRGLAELDLGSLEIQNNEITDITFLFPMIKNSESDEDEFKECFLLIDNPLKVPPIKIVNEGRDSIVKYFENLMLKRLFEDANKDEVINDDVFKDVKYDDISELIINSIKQNNDKNLHINIHHGDILQTKTEIKGHTKVENMIMTARSENSFNKIKKSTVHNDLKSLLEIFNNEALKISEKIEEGKKEEFISDVEILTDEALKEKPNKKYFTISIQGILEATKTVGDLGNTLLGVLPKVIELLK